MSDRLAAKRALANATKEDILREAVHFFSRYGYRRASMDEIARAAGMSRQGLYAHFSTKEKLFEASVEFGIEGCCNMFASSLSAPGISLEDRLLNAFQLMVGNPSGLENYEEIVEMAGSLKVLVDIHGQLVGMIAAALDRTDVPQNWAEAGFTTIDIAELLVSVSNGIKKPTAPQSFRKQMLVAIRMICQGAAKDVNKDKSRN